MHSRVFQLSKEKEFGRIKLGSFVGDIADYILPVSDTQREIDLNWLKDYLKNYNITVDVENETITFNKGCKLEYFKERYNKFKKAAEEVTLEDFAGVSSQSFSKLYDVTGAIEREFGFYIYEDGEGGEEGYLQTLDHFIRENAEEGSTYYIGTIIDYHA